MRYTIRTKIGIALLGLVILATGVMGTAGYFMLVATMRTSQGEALVLLAQLQAERIQERLRGREGHLVAIAHEIEEFRQNNFSNTMKAFLHHYLPEYLWLAVVDPNGRLEFAVGKLNRAQNFSQLPQFKKALAQPGEVVTSLSQSGDGQPSLHLSLSDKKVANGENGVLMGAISLSAILPDAQTRLVGQNGFIMVIDAEARILSHPDSTRLFTVLPVSAPGYQEVMVPAVAMGSGFGRATLVDGDYFAAFVPVGKRGWSVLALLSYDEFMAPVRGFSLWFFGLFVMVILIAGVLSWFISGGVTTSISELTSAIKLFANGRLSTRVHVSTQDEAGLLATSFNKMAQDLENTDQQLRQEIEFRIRAETAQRLASQEAQRANQAKSDFLATMSHEIRTPMNAILGMAELLGSSDLESGQRHAYIRTLQRNGEALLILINDILDVSKMEAGLIHLEQSAFNLEELQAGVVGMFQLMAAENGLVLSGRIDAGLSLYRLGDVHRLRQILINLVGNAIKFTAKGFVTLRVSVPKESLSQERLLFEVADTGMGIPHEQSSRIFEKFIQADGSSTRQFGGTGLGLALCKSLLELMGGEIWVESQLGQGSRFYFTVPLPEVEKSAVEKPVSALAVGEQKAVSLEGLRVLLVEDSQDNVLLMQAFLKKSGIVLTLAEHGEEGVKKFQSDHFDLVLMDMQMPIMDGYSATRAIRAWEVRQGLGRTPILALTAYALTGDAEKSLLAGCDAHLSKPIQKLTLLEVIGHYAVVAKESPVLGAALVEPNGLDLSGSAVGTAWLDVGSDKNGQDAFHF